MLIIIIVRSGTCVSNQSCLVGIRGTGSRSTTRTYCLVQCQLGKTTMIDEFIIDQMLSCNGQYLHILRGLAAGCCIATGCGVEYSEWY